MSHSPEDTLPTRATLLERLKDRENQLAWLEFYDYYRNPIFHFAQKQGLTEVEAEEVVQETIISVARNLAGFRYDPQRCSFKTWLFNMTLWRTQDQLRKRRPEVPSRVTGPSPPDQTSTVERIPEAEGSGFEAIWEKEWEKAVFLIAP